MAFNKHRANGSTSYYHPSIGNTAGGEVSYLSWQPPDDDDGLAGIGIKISSLSLSAKNKKPFTKEEASRSAQRNVSRHVSSHVDSVASAVASRSSPPTIAPSSTRPPPRGGATSTGHPGATSIGTGASQAFDPRAGVAPFGKAKAPTGTTAGMTVQAASVAPSSRLTALKPIVSVTPMMTMMPQPTSLISSPTSLISSPGLDGGGQSAAAVFCEECLWAISARVALSPDELGLLMQAYDAACAFLRHCASVTVFKIGDIELAGSVAKGTAISRRRVSSMPYLNVDVDVVVYIANGGVPLSYQQRRAIVQQWRPVLQSCPGVVFKHAKPDSLGFHIDTVKVDVQLTSHLSPHPDYHLFCAVSDLNVAFDKQSLRHAVALSRHTVAFIRGQSEFARTVIKLAKLWAKTIGVHHIQLKSVVVENVAIQAAKMHEFNGRLSPAMATFFYYLARLDTALIFHSEVTTACGIAKPAAFLPGVYVPVNPHENLLRDKDKEFYDKIRSMAVATLKSGRLSYDASLPAHLH